MTSFMDRVGFHNLEEDLDTFQEAGTRSRREQLMAAIFYRFAEVYDKAFYKTLRRFAEFSMLIHVSINCTNKNNNNDKHK